MFEIKLSDNFEKLPVIALRGLVVFPNMFLHFEVGRDISIKAIKDAMDSEQKIFLVAQKDASVDNPTIDDLYEVGTICSVKQLITVPNSKNLRVAVQGVQRAKIESFEQSEPFIIGNIRTYEGEEIDGDDEENAYRRAVMKEFETYVSLAPKISGEVLAKAMSIKDNGEFCDFISSNAFFDYDDKQVLLDSVFAFERLTKLLLILKKENSTLLIEKEIQEKLQLDIDKNQKEYYLREEMKVIAETLGENENPIDEADNYRKKVNSLLCDDEIKNKLLSECNRLMKMPQGSHEGTVVRNYLDKCLEIPFGKYTKNSVNLNKCRKILDKEHYSLDKVKTRIVESLAVYKRNNDFSGQILCLAGPPGVGKTSIVKSLAKGMNRKYVRVALGGIHDEADIRGHRKTYIGAMTGRIIDALIKSGTMNPIILLDEIDKIGSDVKGNPQDALLEALDPEQNFSFVDHYIDFPVDLSKVMFITTANDTSTISPPLLDRMEVIELSSYTFEEKFHIAKEHLIEKEMKKHNLNKREFKIDDDALTMLIESYTCEAGVRTLEKTIATLCRKAAFSLETTKKSFKVNKDNFEEILGPKKYEKESISKKNLVGTVNGLAWTSVGGTLLPIEVSALKGTGKIELTGNLGDVMKESAKTAVSYVRSKAKDFGIDEDFYKNKDIHIHTPEAAIPKDGPSAGLAITTAIVSELTGIPIKRDVAMTGEISLKGNALKIGGLKEKSMAAYKAGCKTVIVPKDNYKELSEISSEVKDNVTFISADSFLDVIPVALESMPNTLN